MDRREPGSVGEDVQMGPPSERRERTQLPGLSSGPRCSHLRNEGCEEVWEIERQLLKWDNPGLQASITVVTDELCKHRFNPGFKNLAVSTIPPRLRASCVPGAASEQNHKMSGLPGACASEPRPPPRRICTSGVLPGTRRCLEKGSG